MNALTYIDQLFEDDIEDPHEDRIGGVYEGIWRGKPAWAGVADIDGTVISAVSYFKASQSDFHHSHYLRPEDVDGMEEKTRIFWVVLYGKVDLDWMAYGGAEYPVEDKARLMQHITSQISPIKPAENLPKYLRP